MEAQWATYNEFCTHALTPGPRGPRQGGFQGSRDKGDPGKEAGLHNIGMQIQMLSSTNRSCGDRDGLASRLKVTRCGRLGLKTPINFWPQSQGMHLTSQSWWDEPTNPFGQSRLSFSVLNFVRAAENGFYNTVLFQAVPVYLCPAIIRPSLCQVKLFRGFGQMAARLRKYNAKL